MLTTLTGTVAVKTGCVTLCLLNSTYQITLFRLAGLNLMFLGNFLYGVDFHVGILLLHQVALAWCCAQYILSSRYSA